VNIRCVCCHSRRFSLRAEEQGEKFSPDQLVYVTLKDATDASALIEVVDASGVVIQAKRVKQLVEYVIFKLSFRLVL
jgi:hypothetical protein